MSIAKYVLPGLTPVLVVGLYLHSAKKPSAPASPLVPADPLVPAVADEPEVPAVPELADVPLDPSVPVVPLDPDVPDVPLVPEVPDEPSVPDVPSPPAAPARFTSQEPYVPVPLTASTVTDIAPVPESYEITKPVML